MADPALWFLVEKKASVSGGLFPAIFLPSIPKMLRGKKRTLSYFLDGPVAKYQKSERW